MKMIWAVVRSGKVEAVARALKKIGVSGCTVYPVQGYGEQWHLYEPLIHGAHYKLETIVRDEEVERVVASILDQAHSGHEGDGILSVLDLNEVVSVKTKDRTRESLSE
jgi:nitrogen regulatory protein P-II 1